MKFAALLILAAEVECIMYQLPSVSDSSVTARNHANHFQAAGLGMLPSSYLTYQYRNSRSPRVKRSSETRHATKTLTQDHFQIITSNKSLDSFKGFSWKFAENLFENESKLYDNMPTKAFDYMMLMVTLEAVFENTQVRTQLIRIR